MCKPHYGNPEFSPVANGVHFRVSIKKPPSCNENSFIMDLITQMRVAHTFEQCLLIVMRKSKFTPKHFSSYDSFTIYDVLYCGEWMNGVILVSSSNEVLIHFKSDHWDGNNSGFKIEYNPTSNTLVLFLAISKVQKFPHFMY